MKNNLFIIVLKYIASLEKIDAYREKHLQFLERYYHQKVFIVSGPQVPRSGGIIIARCVSKQALEEIIKNDPFSVYELAEYQIYEFTPTRYSDSFERLLEER